jgi:hypothetical protein
VTADLARAMQAAQPPRALYVALALAAIGLAVLAAKRQLRQGSDLGAPVSLRHRSRRHITGCGLSQHCLSGSSVKGQ